MDKSSELKHEEEHLRGLEEAALDGGRLSAEEVRALQSELVNEPDNLTTRAKLLGYFLLRPHEDLSIAKERLVLILWMIDEVPACSLSGEPWCLIHRNQDSYGYSIAKKHWLRQVKLHPTSATVLGNAAHFFTLNDNRLSEQLFRKAEAADPDNWRRSMELADVLRFSRRPTRFKHRLAAMQEALNKAPDEQKRFYILADLADSAYDAGDYDRATAAAEAALNLVNKFSDDWNAGNVIHDCNDVLGRIALKNGDRKLAIEYLLKAGGTNGSPQLDSFGPTMSLAKLLLQAGERDVVIEYLNDCQRFWKEDCLDKWIQEIADGNTPDLR